MNRYVSLLLRSLLAAALLMITAACGIDGDLFWVRRANADLPVLVRGDTSSKRFLVLLHGGPGASSFTYPKLPAFQALELGSAVVYWDQRAAGAALGDPAADTLTIDDYAEDTELVVDALRERYGDDTTVVLLGHSWGGAVGTAYLLDDERQAKVQGWIEMNGAHDLVRAYALSREYMLDYAGSRAEDATLTADERERWQGAVLFYRDHPTLERETLSRHAEYLAHAHAYVYDECSEQEQLGDLGDALAGTPLSLLTWLTHMQRSQSVDAHEVSLTARLGDIRLPTLLIWGTADHAVPVGVASEALEVLGTATNEKELVKLERSGHAPCVEEPAAFVDAVEAFLREHAPTRQSDNR